MNEANSRSLVQDEAREEAQRPRYVSISLGSTSGFELHPAAILVAHREDDGGEITTAAHDETR